MKKVCFLMLISTIFALSMACNGSPEGQTLNTQKEIEVKFDATKKNDGTPEYELTFLSSGKVIAKRIYKNGKTILSEGDIPDGKVIEKYENGGIKNEYYYKNGKRDGKAIGYYENGKIKIQSTYKNDYPEGLSKTYYEDGQLKTESKILNGKKIYFKEYYKTGQLKEDVQYKDGVGNSKMYDMNGNLMRH